MNCVAVAPKKETDKREPQAKRHEFQAASQFGRREHCLHGHRSHDGAANEDTFIARRDIGDLEQLTVLGRKQLHGSPDQLVEVDTEVLADLDRGSPPGATDARDVDGGTRQVEAFDSRNL